MFRSILPIASNTFTDLVRQKVFNFILVFAVCVIAGSLLLVKLSFQEEFQMLKDICLGAMSISTSLLAILATAAFLPKDLEERTIYSLLSKPVPRFSYLLGKLLGVIMLLFLLTVLMSLVFSVVLLIREQTVLAEKSIEYAQADPELLKAALLQVKSSAFNINLLPGITIIFVKASLLAAMTLLISTFSTSFLFTVLIAVGIYFIGHLQAAAREYWMQDMGGHLSRLLVAPIALVFPDLQAFNLSDDVIAGAAISWSIFLQTFALGGLYVTVYFAIAAFIFSGREL